MDLKICTECKLGKPINQFDWKLGKKRSNCKTCVAKYTKQHYLSNKGYYLEKAARNSKLTRQRLRLYLHNYKRIHACVDCGESDPVVLEFDHLKDKVDELASMATRGMSIRRIAQEIEKCEVVCSNCHRRRTAKRANWYTYTGSGEDKVEDRLAMFLKI